jgi:hypothetical protein
MTCTPSRALLLAATLGLTLGCSRQPRSSPESRADGPPQVAETPGATGAAQQPATLTPVVDGLTPLHLREPPVVERVSCPPQASCLTSRVYGDGTLYYLVGSEDAATTRRWNRIGQLTPEGVRKLQELYASLCGQVDPVLANDAGSDRHRVSVPGCNSELTVTGLPSGGLAPIAQVDDILARSMRPIPRQAAP